jgi:uncharacterized protein
MSGEKDLHKLLRNMSPELVAGEFVFCSFENSGYGDHAQLQPVASFTENEGLTLVIPRATADRYALHYESVFSCITLRVHSDLAAIGLTAAFATKLTQHGISANVIAGYFHDHIFVQQELAQKALAAINELACPPAP